MASSTVTCDTSSHKTMQGVRKSKKIITIDLSSISCILNRIDDTTNIVDTMNTMNTMDIRQDEEKNECCIDEECLNNNTDAGDGEKNGYYYRNREKKLEYQKNYNREQGDKIKNYNKDYYQKRREEILEKAKTKVMCNCGCEVQLFNMNSHKKTKKHAKALAAINAKI